MWFNTKKIRRQVCLEPDLYVATRCHAFRSSCDAYVALASPISMVFPWRYRRFRFNQDPEAVPNRSIDIGAVDTQVSLSCFARLDFSCPVTRDCRKKNDIGEEEMAGVRVGIDTICFFLAYYAFQYTVYLLKLC